MSILSYAKTTHSCVEAADILAKSGVSSEVIDLRSLKPLDEDAILRSARKTGRVLIVHEASRMCGVGAEVAAIVAQKAFHSLKAPVHRLTGPDTPAPSSYMLEQAFIPQVNNIVETVKTMLD